MSGIMPRLQIASLIAHGDRSLLLFQNMCHTGCSAQDNTYFKSYTKNNQRLQNLEQKIAVDIEHLTEAKNIIEKI